MHEIVTDTVGLEAYSASILGRSSSDHMRVAPITAAGITTKFTNGTNVISSTADPKPSTTGLCRASNARCRLKLIPWLDRG